MMVLTSVTSSSSSSSSSSVNSPSFGRRHELKEIMNGSNFHFNVVDGYQLSNYIEQGYKILEKFEHAFERSNNLDEAYVYGMSFAELVVTDLPKHKDWNEKGKEEREMKSKVSKVLSRLEIIKRRMDAEESKKLRTSLARADDEIRMQNQHNLEMQRREREEAHQHRPVHDDKRDDVPNFLHCQNDGMIPSNYESNIVITERGSSFDLQKQKSMSKKARSSIRKLLGIPKGGSIRGSTISRNDTENSSLSSSGENSTISTKDSPRSSLKLNDGDSSPSGPAMPSLDAIRKSREYELQQSRVY